MGITTGTPLGPYEILSLLGAAATREANRARDPKPADFKITPDGRVKVLNVGLAKAMASDAPDANLSNAPTMITGGSMAGMILGTAAYMSPEQAKGRAVDKRTDIFAFGCVLYE